MINHKECMLKHKFIAQCLFPSMHDISWNCGIFFLVDIWSDKYREININKYSYFKVIMSSISKFKIFTYFWQIKVLLTLFHWLVIALQYYRIAELFLEASKCTMNVPLKFQCSLTIKMTTPVIPPAPFPLLFLKAIMGFSEHSS